MCDIIYLQRPKVCKKCGGKVLEIVYGYPSHKTFKIAERGEIVFGGCCIEDDHHDIVCRDCHQGYKKVVPDYLREDIFPDLLASETSQRRAMAMKVQQWICSQKISEHSKQK